jgi:hypothetical protein
MLLPYSCQASTTLVGTFRAPEKASPKTTLVSSARDTLDFSKQPQYEQDDEDKPQAAARSVAPAGTVGPRGQRADQEKN